MSNLSILFWVRKSAANKNGLAPLQIRITLPNKDISNFSSGKMVDVELWNPDKKRVNGRSDDADRINQYITRSTTKIEDVFDELEKDNKPISAEILKNIFIGKATLRLTILGVIDEHNEAFREKVKREKKGSLDTVKIFENVKAKLVKFLWDKHRRKDMFVSEINFIFIEEYETWLLQYGHHKSGGLSKDTATGHLKKLNKITTYLFKRGHIKSDPFIDKSLKWEKPSAEGLSQDQLERLEKLTLTIPRLQKVLDRFIVGCYSGMAHSDISKVSRNDVIKSFADDNGWIKLRRTKTDELCKIPILEPVQKIIEKYENDPQCIADNKLFPTVGLNSCNEYLKEIAVFAGVTGINVSTHTARHTFSILMQDLGMDIDVLAQILGHSSGKTTRSVYARGSFAQVSNEIEKIKNIKFPKMKIVEEAKNAG